MTAMLNQVRQLADGLQRHGLTLATVESCTGGGIAARLTALAGSSAWFERGFVTYSNASKTELVGVDATLIETRGAVSAAVAEAMANGAVERTPASCAVSVTGIAGPDGGSADKPVGTVFIGWAMPIDSNQSAITVVSERFRFDGDREAVRRQSIDAAIDGLVARLA